MKVLLIIAAIVLLAVILAGIHFWYLMKQPLYKPGMVKAGQNLRSALEPPAQTGDSHYWNVAGDIRLYHFAKGEGENVLIIHGGPGFPFREAWPGLEPLTSRYRFHYYDQRGCGKSTRPFNTFSSGNYYQNMKTLDSALGLGAQIADIERVRRILGDEKLIVIGHSFGAFLAALYAAEFPEHIKAMVLVSPAPMLLMPMETESLFDYIQNHLSGDEHEKYISWRKDYLDFKNLFTRSESELVRQNEELAAFFGAATHRTMPVQGEPGGWMVHAMYLSMGQQHDYRDAVKKVKTPVMIVHGADNFQTESASRTYEAVFENTEFEVIEKSSHMPFYEQPEMFTKIMEIFLKELQ